MEVGKIAGIQVRIHPSLLIMLALFGVLGLLAQALMVFALVLGHEVAHLLAARAFGFKVIGLELFPYGGTAYFDDLFEGRKWEESMMALAGPFFNLILLFAAQFGRWEGLLSGAWAEDFVRFNLYLAAFNLLPILPLDGGRVVRAVLAESLGFVRVTKSLAWAGKLTGVVFALVGLAWAAKGAWNEGPLTLIVLGVFFWLAGSKEVATARITFLRQLSHKKEELVAKGLMKSKWVTARADTPVVRIVEELTPDRYTLISLADEEFELGKTLTESQVLEGMLREGIYYPVGKL
ncbi:M50 family metallopeptidase [Paradesulfitobacterium aromaticivorans]